MNVLFETDRKFGFKQGRVRRGRNEVYAERRVGAPTYRIDFLSNQIGCLSNHAQEAVAASLDHSRDEL